MPARRPDARRSDGFDPAPLVVPVIGKFREHADNLLVTAALLLALFAILAARALRNRLDCLESHFLRAVLHRRRECGGHFPVLVVTPAADLGQILDGLDLLRLEVLSLFDLRSRLDGRHVRFQIGGNLRGPLTAVSFSNLGRFPRRLKRFPWILLRPWGMPRKLQMVDGAASWAATMPADATTRQKTPVKRQSDRFIVASLQLGNEPRPNFVPVIKHRYV